MSTTPTEPAAGAGAVRVVLDTNVALDWLIFADAQVRPVADAIERRHLAWLATAAMRDELARALVHPSIIRRPVDRDRVLARFDSMARLCPAPPAQRVLRCRDPDDQVFVDLAIACGARCLLTRDKALLALARRARRHPAGLRIVAPRHWPPT